MSYLILARSIFGKARKYLNSGLESLDGLGSYNQ